MRHQRQVLPEHEAAFRELSCQRTLLENAFMRIGEVAQSYYEGLKRERGGAAGYHLQRILKLADRYGSDVIAGALSYAQRYGAYSADSIARIVHGKTLTRKGKQSCTPEEIPENMRQWLRTCATQKHNLTVYDRMICPKKEETKEE
jgi:hypothetical protein